MLAAHVTVDCVPNVIVFDGAVVKVSVEEALLTMKLMSPVIAEFPLVSVAVCFQIYEPALNPDCKKV